MAIPVIQSRSEQKLTSNNTTITITAPAGIVDNDVLIICLATDGNSTNHIFPSGFVLIGEVHAPLNRATLLVLFKIASSESGNYIVTWTGNEQAIAEMYRIDGAVLGSEIQDPNESNTGTSALATITPAIATDSTDSLVLVVMGIDRDRVTVDGGGDADYVVEDVDQSGGANGAGVGVQSRGQVSAGVPPQCDLTLTASDEWAALWFAIKSNTDPVVSARRVAIISG